MSGFARLLIGDARDRLADIPAGSVQTCVTSPPYFGLRRYLDKESADGQREIGAGTLGGYIRDLVLVCRGIRRALRPDGTLWLNLGDSYAGSWGNYGRDTAGAANGQSGTTINRPGYAERADWVPPTVRPGGGIKDKDLIGVPWRVAFALQADGWYLRSDVVWAKRNPMPESVLDRPTRSHEYLFLLSVRDRYYYDALAIAEPIAPESANRYAYAFGGEKADALIADGRRTQVAGERAASSVRNKRDVWHLTSDPYPGSHYAVMPPALVEPCILAGSPPAACAACGAPHTRLVDRIANEAVRGVGYAARRGQDREGGGMDRDLHEAATRAVDRGFAPSCACAAGAAQAVVLDPFFGSGTVGMVARSHLRSFWGIDLDARNRAMARERIGPMLLGGADGDG